LSVSRLAAACAIFFSATTLAQKFWEQPCGALCQHNPLPKAPNLPLPQLPTLDDDRKALQAAPGAVVKALGDAAPAVIQAAGQGIGKITEQTTEGASRIVTQTADNYYATYVKAWRDGAEEAKRDLNQVSDAGKASLNFTQREAQDYANAARTAAHRAREGKLADAAWGWTISGYTSDQKNFFKATQESALINEAAATAAATYGGPGGAAAYAAWQTYQTTGDANLAFRAGLLAAASSQAGAATSQMPSGTLGQVVEKAAMAGAAGGIAVAAAGGDQTAIEHGFLKSGGAVIVQSSTDTIKGYSPKLADAAKAVDCISARDLNCLANTTYARQQGKILMDKYGQPIQDALAANETIGKWTAAANQAAEITKISKLPNQESIPVMDNKWVLTWTLGQAGEIKKGVPAVVLTQVAHTPPFIYSTRYGKASPQADAAIQPGAAAGPPPGKTAVSYACTIQGSTRHVTETPQGQGCEAIYQRPGQGDTVLWSTPHGGTDACVQKAVAFVQNMEHQGMKCQQTR